MVEISIDLETLGLKHSAYILSIGATAFDIRTGRPMSEFYAVIGFNDASQNDRTKCKETIEWWGNQEQKAIDTLQHVNCLGLNDALVCFSDWVKPLGEITVWGNGRTFDIGILENAYNYNFPWEFYNEGCVRTVLRRAQSKGYTKPEFKGVEHTALDDARNQARIIHDAWNYGK